MGKGTTTSLLIAQASTLVAAPLCAGLLLAFTSSANVMGDLKNRAFSVVVGLAGLVVLLGLGARWVMGRLA